MDFLTVFLFAFGFALAGYMIVTGIVRMSTEDIKKRMDRIENLLKESGK